MHVVTPLDVVQIVTVNVTEAEIVYGDEALTSVLKSACELLVFASKAPMS